MKIYTQLSHRHKRMTKKNSSKTNYEIPVWTEHDVIVYILYEWNSLEITTLEILSDTTKAKYFWIENEEGEKLVINECEMLELLANKLN